jgi:hypothetical protein
MQRGLAAAIFVSWAGAACAAANLPLETLPANARWVLHLDAQALRRSPLGDDVLAALARSPADSDLRAFRETTGVDICREVHVLTVCGAGSLEQGGVVYLNGRWELPRLSAALTASGATVTRYGTRTLLTWPNPGGGEGFEHETACLVSSNLVLLGNREASMRQALDALDGRAPSLATAPRFRRALGMDTNALLRVLAVDLREVLSGSPEMDRLPVGESLRLAVSLAGGSVELKAVLKTDSPAAAQQVQQGLFGLQALLSFEGLKLPAAGKVAQAARVGVNGQDVNLLIQVPQETVRELLAGTENHGGKKARKTVREPPGSAM